MRVTYDGEELDVQKLRYVEGNSICIQLFDPLEGPYCTATLNVPGKTGGRVVAIKNYAENNGIEKALIDGKIIEEKPIGYIPVGRDNIPLYEVTVEFLKMPFSR